ncbi:AraC family transcriptional regulator [Geodermatophilus sp. SYSU D00708]
MVIDIAQPAAVQRSSFSSRDAEEVTEFYRQTYVDHRTRFGSVRDRDGSVDAVTAGVPGLVASDVRSGIDYSLVPTGPWGSYLVSILRRGRMRLHHGGEELLVSPGEAVIFPHDAPLEAEVVDLHVRLLQLPTGRLDQVADEVAGVPVGALRFDAMTAVSPAMATYWRSVMTLASGALLAEDSPMNWPLVAEEMVRTISVAALHVFPNTSMTRHHLAGPGQVAPAALRRAVAYVDAHADRPVTLSEIATAAGTGARALQYAFRRHHGTTPLGYARRVRLEHAHRELQAADPARGATVGAIAARWGFAKADRFTAAYRGVFGVLPRDTLRS